MMAPLYFHRSLFGNGARLCFGRSWRACVDLPSLVVFCVLAAASMSADAADDGTTSETILSLDWADMIAAKSLAPPELLDFKSCSDHISKHDWNENVSDEQWRSNYLHTASCIRHHEQLAREAGNDRPVAQSGVHIPTMIVPTQTKDLPELPPYYFVLPVWDFVVSNRIKLSGTYDPQELDILTRLVQPGESFVDIGANVGAVTVPLATHIGREGIVYAFEPFRQVFQYLNANIAINGLANVHAFHTALSDGITPSKVIVPAPTLEAVQNAGMYAVFQADSHSLNVRTSETRERMEEVSVQTLDSFALPRVDVIKIDVEGHAPRVLAGSIQTLRKCRPILWFEEGSSQPPDVVTAADLGYWCTKFDAETTQEDQWLCVPKERHQEIQERLVAE